MTQFSYKDPLEREIYLLKKNDQLSEIVVSLFKESYKIEKDSFKIGVLGDLHGHITKGLEKMQKWEKFSNQKLDAIVQIGDLGVFNEHTALDKTTLELSEKDPDELGFKDYYLQSNKADHFFGNKGVLKNTPFYFCLGNHDDPEVMEYTNQPCFYKNIKFMPNGELIKLIKKKKSINIGALGHNHASNNINKLSREKLDILLTHQPPKSLINPRGDRKTGDFINNFSPTYTFFGHIHTGVFDITFPYSNLFGLAELSNDENKSKGSSGILYISPEKKSQFIYLPDLI